MVISIEKLLENGGVRKVFLKNEIIFHEGENARYFYMIEKGRVKMYSTSDEGKEFTQGFFEDGATFGEPPLLINKPYPASAIATKETVIVKILKADFFKLLDQNPSIQKGFMILFADRIYEKTIAAKEIVNHTPEERILAFLNTYKRKNSSSNMPILVNHTRQEIANFTGLCVETVIRTLTRMEKKQKVAINNRKIFY